MKMKVIGGRNLPDYWTRFDRLQRTTEKLRRSRHPRGVFRFASHEALEAWKQTLLPKPPGSPTAPTSSPSAEH